ncbi:BZ3500_MvSof-1268-A1-R1_Chr2-2g04892 [Microbotryum saponariae]|uniref:BZ3500_MvSof-1268-A1-R1_Chr2-2g04892 protein n=1 Tax=Microbotryum saponariae TaxID=289078 RepID=A0A2X0L693_9BASI|nr:BZ3500_MvSof-1268-A1-R1_Chr2-2g04892 [Microbotryum saponariae]SDA00420.1 BZ3501_MvSof-1269-A2-R1_Chr2-2g04566 [Microbotryum saponariae]
MAPVSLPLFSFLTRLCRLSSAFWPDSRTCSQLAGPARLSLSCSSNFLVWSPLVRRSETYHCLSSPGAISKPDAALEAAIAPIVARPPQQPASFAATELLRDSAGYQDWLLVVRSRLQVGVLRYLESVRQGLTTGHRH